MTRNLLLFAIFLFSVCAFHSPFTRHPSLTLFNDAPMSDDPDDRYQWELMRLADPATGRIPADIRRQELEFVKSLPKMYSISATSRNNSDISSQSVTFTPRGPWNLGGRTRCFAADVANENIFIAGTVNGGLFRSTNKGTSWTRVIGIDMNPSMAYLEQDKRPGHTNTWYCATGEGYGQSASATGAYYNGNGVYKSTDNGLTWNFLPSTSSNTPHIFDINWDVIWKVRVDRSNLSNDVVYAACYGAVYRSLNGGASWNIERGTISTPFSYYTDVDVTSKGAVYATLSSDGTSQKGIWRKDSVNAWTLISPPTWDTARFNRVVIGINPQNENVVYFLGYTPYSGKMTTNYKGDPEWNSLWKYTYISGNGSGAGGSWQNLSANIPYDGSNLGNFNTQGGYDLLVAVHPGDSNIVYIGGTNLFRSTSAFTTSTNTTEIGGYDPVSTLPFYAVYPNHHPDQHNVFFLPSNPDVMLQSNDGGIFVTNDDRATPVVWQPLNNGYITGQFYTVAIDHASTPNDIVIGGVQDNGTWFTNNTNILTPWKQPGAGDGSYCAMTDGHQMYYMSRQQGRVAKTQLDASGNVTGFRRIDPIGGSDYIFISPFILDPNNNNIMYLAAGRKIFRNDSLNQIPLTGAWDTISTGWYQIPDTVTTSGAFVTALAISKSPANRLYYGISKKNVYRVDSANTFSPVTTNITATIFPGSGCVSCIEIDPSDANKIIVAYSNYQVYSLFYSTDGGATFTKIGGNLEAVTNGSGAGPSVRWVKIVPTIHGNVYLVGTSAGLYGTNQLNGLSTVWMQLAPNEIGNLVVDMMDSRTCDGLVAIGTHGAGVFSTFITDTLLTGVKELASQGQIESSMSIYPNPFSMNSATSLTTEFYSPKNSDAQLQIFSSSGQLVYETKASVFSGNNKFKNDIRGFERGLYYVVLKEEDGTTVTKKLVIQ